MSDRAKIRNRRVSGNDVQQQREVAGAIKIAREMALLPYARRVATQRTRPPRDGRPGRERDVEGAAERPEAAEVAEPVEQDAVEARSAARPWLRAATSPGGHGSRGGAVKLILRADVDGLGKRGDIVDVADGYGRNYLLPRGMAFLATSGAVDQAAKMRRAAISATPTTGRPPRPSPPRWSRR